MRCISAPGQAGSGEWAGGRRAGGRRPGDRRPAGGREGYTARAVGVGGPGLAGWIHRASRVSGRPGDGVLAEISYPEGGVHIYIT